MPELLLAASPSGAADLATVCPMTVLGGDVNGWERMGSESCVGDGCQG